MTTVAYALGEVQEPGAPATRHAVADASPGGWGQSVCPAAARVWVHEVAGASMPFPGPLGGDAACRECVDVVSRARASAEAEPKRTLREWLRRPPD